MRRGTALASLALAALLSTGSTPVSARSQVAAAESPALFVRVIDAATEMPVAGAEVLVSFEGGDPDKPYVTGVIYNGVANGGGHAFFGGLQPGGYVVSVRADGYVSFGDGAHGDRLPTGQRVTIRFRFGGGAEGNVPVHVFIRLVPICRDCQITH